MIDEWKKAIVEALIFASNFPLTIDKIKEILKISKDETLKIIEDLRNDYNSNSRGIYIKKVANGFQFRTKSEYSSWIKQLRKVKPIKLSQPLIETLAMIAYKQPITRVEIEQIRGVNSETVIKTLLERKLIKILGRKQVPGRPFLFGTTDKFLEVFGLSSLNDLPVIENIDQLSDDSLRFFTDSKHQE